MFIKRVLVRGFKTYRAETLVDELSPHTNLVLGKNGSGQCCSSDAELTLG
jgi:structural maintenance of chromosome 3 (chondroitin sulfate proteoglycan 6)